MNSGFIPAEFDPTTESIVIIKSTIIMGNLWLPWAEKAY